MRIVLTGGGTGGHLTPLLAVAGALRGSDERSRPQVSGAEETALELIALGVFSDADRETFAAAGIPAVNIPSGKIRRYLSGVHLTVLDFLFRLPLGSLRALWKLFFLMPDVVFSKGGYGSVPVTIAAWIYRIPVLLHESDLRPGLSNTRLARFASAIAVGYRAAEEYFPAAKVFVSGTPLRPSFLHLPTPEAARQRLGLHDQKPVLFVTGGSQGSQRVNTAVLTVLVTLLPEVQILHQVGTKNLEAVRNFVQNDLRHVPEIGDYHLVGSLSEEDMALSMAAADFIVSRAGGTTLAEIAAAGKPSLLIPLREAAQQHQWENAYFFREQGAAVVLDESNLSPAVLLSTLRRLLANPQDRQLMAERVRALHRPTAADDIAAVLVEMAQGRVPRRAVPSVTP